MISYKKWLVRIVEQHFDEAVPALRADVARNLWRSVPSARVCSVESFTRVLDLANSPHALLSKMHPNVRYAVRRAQKDRLQYGFSSANDPEALVRFCRFYDGFAASKGLPGANRQRLSALAQAGLLDLSWVADQHGTVLVWHAHCRTQNRVRLIHSASLRRSSMEPSLRALIGRGNCYQTWKDILRFQQQGICIFDLGGWYGGGVDHEKLGINWFKQNFGGEIVKEFSADIPLTAIGHLALALRRIYSWRPRKLVTVKRAGGTMIGAPPANVVKKSGGNELPA